MSGTVILLFFQLTGGLWQPLPLAAYPETPQECRDLIPDIVRKEEAAHPGLQLRGVCLTERDFIAGKQL